MPKFNSDQILDKVIKYGDRLSGSTKSKLNNAVHVLDNASHLGIPGIRPRSIHIAKNLARKESKAVLRTRVKTGLGVAAVGGAGFLGLHKYHQHKDNKILERIDKMGRTD
jgi:hypothetical protein